MPKFTAGFNPAEYATVAERIALFRAAYPFGRIETRLHSRDAGRVTFVAAAYRHADDAKPAATGWASEREGDGEVNLAACLENTETSAIGRALANLGFSAARQRASLEEMVAAGRPSNRAALRLVREPPPPSSAAAPVARRGTSGAPGPAGGRDADAALQQAADALADVLGLLANAERLGLPPRQSARLRRTLEGRSVPPSAITRAERDLRTWFEEHVPAPALALASPPDASPPDALLADGPAGSPEGP